MIFLKFSYKKNPKCPRTGARATQTGESNAHALMSGELSFVTQYPVPNMLLKDSEPNVDCRKRPDLLCRIQ